MEDWSRSEFLALEGFVLAFFTFLCALVGIRASIKIATNAPSSFKHSVRYTFYLWFLGFMCIATMFGVWMIVKPFQTEASKNTPHQPQPISTPSPQQTTINHHPSTAVQTSENQTSSATTASSNETQKTPSPKGIDFLIDGIRYDYSHNALMGKFSGTIFIENGSVKFVSPHPVFRLAGRHEIWGKRTITGIRIGIADHDELMKVSRGEEADVTWSNPFKLTATRDHGEEYPENKTIELSVPVGMTDVKGKAIIVQIDNELTSSGKTLEPSYAISGGEIFSGSLSSRPSVNNRTRRKRVPIRRRNSC